MPPTAPPDTENGPEAGIRHVTQTEQGANTQPTPPNDEMEGRYRIYTLCLCDPCGGHGTLEGSRCKTCRGEGKTLSCVATATDPESVGAALVTLALEGEFESCPIGLMDRPEGQTGTWLVKPWLASPRNVSDAGRVLQTARQR